MITLKITDKEKQTLLRMLNESVKYNEITDQDNQGQVVEERKEFIVMMNRRIAVSNG